MKLLLSKLGYQLNSQTNVWLRPDYLGIAYTDGDKVEQRIAAIIEKANDITVLSAELRQHCTDWPSLYHLTSARANVLRPFEPDLRGDILEIGAGCGAITRYLGECGGKVLALEGSPRRAAIARGRTRDLPNVTVVSDNFNNFKCEEKFDVITLIGVLEYANLFTIGETPALTMLQSVLSFLKPNGRLIIAIENQLGLKYFAGAPEDHLGLPMYGIEGRYPIDKPQTYGRKTLAQILSKAGFSYSEFMAPFPDYKLPVSIVTESGFSDEAFDAGALAWQSVRRDPQLPPILTFSPELVWPILVKNEVALDFANSFLVVAGRSIKRRLDSRVLAWHYTSERSKEFCKETRFLRNDNGLIEVQYHLLAPESTKNTDKRRLKFYVPEKTEYVHGKPLSQELVHIVTQDDWRIEDVGAFMKRYLHVLGSIDSTRDVPLQFDSADMPLPGGFFDLLPQNIIVGHDGSWQVIDKEWTLNDDIAVGYLIFRSLLSLVHTVTRFAATTSDLVHTPLGFFHGVFKAIGFSVTEGEIESYANLEMEFQAEVAQRPMASDEFLYWLRYASLPRQNLSQAMAERDAQLVRFQQEAIERDGHIVHANQVVTERDMQLVSLEKKLAEQAQQVAELNSTIRGYKGSRSWRITTPLRFVSSSIKALSLKGLNSTIKLRVAIKIVNISRLKKTIKLLLKGRLYEIRLKIGHQLRQHKAYFPVDPRASYTLIQLLNKNPDVLLSGNLERKNIDIVIPIFNGIEYLAPLFDSLLKNTAHPYRIIAVNDGSQDPQVSPLLQKYSAQFDQFILLNNDKNIGFVESVNRAVQIVKSDIFILLNTDIELPPNWLDRLIAPILSDEQVASATPFSNSATICSFPNFVEDNDLYLGLSANKIDSAFSEIPLLKEPICLPTGVGFCMAINRKAVTTLGMFDSAYGRGYGEENDWCMRVAAEGYKHVLVNNLFVYHRHGGSFPSEARQVLVQRNLEILTSRYPQYESLVRCHIKMDPARQIRQLVKLKIASRLTEHGSVLIVDHNLGGGANNYRRELTQSYLKAGRPVLVFVDDSRSQSTYLQVFIDKEEFTFHLETLQLINSIFESVNINEVIYNNAVAASEPLKIIELLGRLKIDHSFKLIILIHDFYPICPSYTLLNKEGHYCCVPSDTRVCERCLPKISSRVAAYIPPNIDIKSWRDVWANMLKSSDEIRCFSENSRLIVLKAYPSIADKIKVEPHIVDWGTNGKPLINIDAPMHIGVVGGINYAKGLDTVLSLADLIQKYKQNIKITVLGEVDAVTPINGLNVTGRYKKEELPKLIEKLEINIFLLPSITPETFSYVTSELMQMNVPVACFDLGAPADRVRGYQLGRILPSIKPLEILSELQTFHAELKEKLL